MRNISMTCSKCNGTMYLDESRNITRLVCPFCGNIRILRIESDEVRITGMTADVARTHLEYRHNEHCDYIQMEKKRQAAQIVVICSLVVLLISLVLIWAFN